VVSQGDSLEAKAEGVFQAVLAGSPEVPADSPAAAEDSREHLVLAVSPEADFPEVQAPADSLEARAAVDFPAVLAASPEVLVVQEVQVVQAAQAVLRRVTAPALLWWGRT